MSWFSRRVIFIQICSVVLGIHHLESRLYYELFYYAQSYIPLLSLFKWRHPFVMHLIIHMFNISMIPYISVDQYLNPNSYTIPNMQNMRFFCCPVYKQANCAGIKKPQKTTKQTNKNKLTKNIPACTPSWEIPFVNIGISHPASTQYRTTILMALRWRANSGFIWASSPGNLVFRAFDQVIQKLACSATETS